MAVLAEVANCVPELAPLAAKCYGKRFVFYGLRGDQDNSCSSGVQQGGPMGLVMIFLVLRPGLKHFREESEQEQLGTFASMDDVSLSALWWSRPTRLEPLPSFGKS